MFVPYKPTNCFDTYKGCDRCVCGVLAIVTNHQGENKSYCQDCFKKRNEFVNDIIGDIYIGEKGSLDYKILEVLEAMRKGFYKERLYYKVDSFFAENPRIYEGRLIDFLEPYNDNIFIAGVYHEKQLIDERFITVLDEISKFQEKKEKPPKLTAINLKKRIPRIYDVYKKRLEEMREQDEETISVIHAKIGGYTHSKKIKKPGLFVQLLKKRG